MCIRDSVLLRVMALFLPVKGLAHCVVVVAQCHTQHFLGLILLDDVAVEVCLDVARLVGELEIISVRFRLRLGTGIGWLGTGKTGSTESLELLLQELLHLFLKFLG